MPKDEVHPDMSESDGDNCATRMNLGRAADQRDRNQTNSGPKRLGSLANGGESDSPTDENGSAEIERPANVEIEKLAHAICRDERRIGPRQKDFPTRPQNQQGNEPGPSKKDERGYTEHRPRRSDAPGLEPALLYFESWSWEDALTKSRPNHICRRAKVAMAGLKKRLKLDAVAFSPGTRIQA